jgi:hypothetical protein
VVVSEGDGGPAGGEAVRGVVLAEPEGVGGAGAGGGAGGGGGGGGHGERTGGRVKE